MGTVSRCLGQSCPVTALVPPTDVWNTDAILAAARAALADDPGRQREVGGILRHVLLTHIRDTRPQVAQALAEVTPGETAGAVAEIRRFLADTSLDPLAAGGSAAAALRYRVLLGLLGDARQDASEIDAAAAATDDAEFVDAAAGYAMLGPEQARSAALRLAAIARGGAVPPMKACWPMLGFGREFHPLVREVLNEIVDAGTPLHTLVGSPAVRAAGFDDDAAALALRSLPLGPAFAVRRRHHQDNDVVTRILECGEHYRGPAVLALLATAENTTLPADRRWHAAYRVADLDDDSLGNGADGGGAFQRISAALLAAGVEDPTAGPLPPELSAAEVDAVRERVALAWGRIREQLQSRYPAFDIRFGPGATDAEIAALEVQLGFQLPVDFAASLALYREVAFDGLILGLCPQADISIMAGLRVDALDWEEGTQEVPEIRGDYAWRPGWIPLDQRDSDYDVLDLDPAPAGRYGQVVRISHDSSPDVHAGSWLEMLERVADHMEADRYAVQSNGQVLWLD